MTSRPPVQNRKPQNRRQHSESPSAARQTHRVRKAGAAVEFGAKVSISLENGYSRIEKLSWNPYNEAGTLIETVERYKYRNDCYTKAILADRICQNRDKLVYCNEYGIRIRGPKLGRPPAKSLIKKAEKRIERQDARECIAVEVKFGEGKRKYGLARIFAKLKETSECMISMQFLVMNLERKLRVLFVPNPVSTFRARKWRNAGLVNKIGVWLASPKY